ncbi:MFS transporter [Pseudopelagicola sp. nBUS_19]|uniref:MFS transporter n=1 Tax=Pseudopelagicola sp. nBUS_19 TaxID=3395316 RepID=UPI003EB7D93A
MIDFVHTSSARFATRLAFFAAGFAMACCAPMVPYIKSNVGVDEGQFGFLLLCLGLGSLIAMPATGIISARRGARPMVMLGGIGLFLFLPILAAATSPFLLGIALFLFGASLGTLDVAMNIHGAEVEGRERRPLMSSFHALFSVGGLFGAGFMTVLLSLNVPLVLSASAGAVLVAMATFVAGPRLLHAKTGEPEPLIMPRGIVWLLALLSAIAFLTEGAVLDWGALLIIDRQLAPTENAGIGYILFSIAMVFARLAGGMIVQRFGELRVLVYGGVAIIFGIVIILTSPWHPIALFGFFVIGLGAANLVPILFSAAGRQKKMPAGLALASVTTIGYAGILMGPVLVGVAAKATDLLTAFWLVAFLTALIPLAARFVARI